MFGIMLNFVWGEGVIIDQTGMRILQHVFFRYQKFDENMFVKIVCWGMSEEKKEPMSFSMR